MMEILGSIRKFFGYPWQKDWVKPPYEAQLYSGEGSGFFTYLPIGMATSRLIELAFTSMFQGQLESNMAIALPVELLILLSLVVLPFYLNHRDPKWLLWIWKGGAVLQRGTERIELTHAEVSQMKEVSRGRLCLELFHGKRRYRLPLAKTANLLGLRHLLGSQTGTLEPAGASVFQGSYHLLRESIVITLGLLVISLASLQKQFIISGDTDILLSVISVCSTAFLIWKLYEHRPLTVSLTDKGIARKSFPSCFIRWDDVKAVTIDQSTRKADDSLTIESGVQKITIPASTPNYWHLEQQILDRVPTSAQVVRL